MREETVLSWDIQSLTTTTVDRSFFKRDVVHQHTLLRNVRGCAKSGNLLAIMGPSGAGKTTLLATLSKRNSGNMVGEVLLNGHSIDKDLMIKISGFVPQQDLAVKCLTSYEHLTFMASMKLDRRISKSQKERIVCKLVNDLNLTSCINTQISALSGGERKRLSLAAQMVTDPPLLFCDEPTTGLDSYSATSVVQVLKTLASRCKTVVCSIHQPSSEVYSLFDQVCFLVAGGGLAYCGTVNGAQPYFASLDMECPILYNPADFLLSKLNSSPEVTQELCHQFTESSNNQSITDELVFVKKSFSEDRAVFGINEKFLMFYSVQPPSQHTQLRWLVWRGALAMFRDSQRTMLRFVMYMLIALLVSTPYVSVQLNQAGIQSLQGFHYAIITETIFCHSYAVLHTFPAEIAIMLREINSGVYQPGPYYFSKAFILLPRVVMETFCFCMVAFIIVGVEGGSLGFLMFSSPAIASAIASTAYGCCVSAMFENVTNASLFTVPMDFISYTFSGLFLHLSTAPFYLKWLKYVSRFYYGIEAMSIMQWKKVENIPCSENMNIPCISSGEGVLTEYGFSHHNLPLDFLGLLATFVVLHVVGFLALKQRSKKQAVY